MINLHCISRALFRNSLQTAPQTVIHITVQPCRTVTHQAMQNRFAMAWYISTTTLSYGLCSI